MSEETVTVNKRGQFTIPARFRKQLRIQEGTKLVLTQDEYAIIVRRVPKFDDLLGMHAGAIKLEELLSDLNTVRTQDRY
jgi:AbrB family looped-hinge helix DNA binding protein